MNMMSVVTDPRELRRLCVEISETEDVSKLAEEMAVTMYVEGGVGLAAPQVGVVKRLIVLDPTTEGSNESLFTLINPVIIHSSIRCENSPEGCLSLPGQLVDVERALSITVKYRSLDGKTVVGDFNDFAARVIQHEIDHLDGSLMTDKKVEAL